MVATLDVFVAMLLVLDEMLDAFVLMRVESDVKDPLKSTPDKDTAGVLNVPTTATLPPSEVFPLTLRLPTSVVPIVTEFWKLVGP
jgi:HAMP domain-containing protein